MITAREAERCAFIAWQSFLFLTSSEIAAQETIGATPKDFESYALQYLAEAFLVGKPRVITKRIDATKGHSGEDVTGDYHFPDPSLMYKMTYTQAIMALQDQVPLDLRKKFKRLHAAGATPFDAYKGVIADWERMRGHIADRATLNSEALHSAHVIG